VCSVVLLFNVKQGTTKYAKSTKGILAINFVLFVYFVVPSLGVRVDVLLFYIFLGVYRFGCGAGRTRCSRFGNSPASKPIAGRKAHT